MEHQPRPRRAQELPVPVPQDHGQRDVQRRRLVERLVEAAQRVEQEGRRPLDRRLPEAEMQRPCDEAGAGHERGRDQPQRMSVERVPAAGQEQRQRVEDVDRPVQKDRPRPERHVPLPVEGHRRHVRPRGRPPVGEAVGCVEQRPQKHQPCGGALPGPLCQPGAHRSVRTASDTVKMPHSSIRWSILRKPAASTSWSISYLRAPAHHPGLALAVAGERARDQLELRMPRLAGVDAGSRRARSRRASPRASGATMSLSGNSS